jgi:hypothetical protein
MFLQTKAIAKTPLLPDGSKLWGNKLHPYTRANP